MRGRTAILSRTPARCAQNSDGSSTYGARWHWAGAQQEHAAPLRSPNADTAGNTGYNAANTTSPQRRTYLSPTTAGNERHLYGQGKPNAMDAADLTEAVEWSTGIVSEDTTGEVQVESRLFYQGTVEGGGSANELSRLTDAREKGRIGILGSALAYAGSYGRVTSESIGRDLNPLGRGDGGAYVAGGLNLGRISPALPGNMSPGGWGNSVNNGCGDLNGGGGTGMANPNCEYCCTQWLDIMCNSHEIPAMCIGCKPYCNCAREVEPPTAPGGNSIDGGSGVQDPSLPWIDYGNGTPSNPTPTPPKPAPLPTPRPPKPPKPPTRPSPPHHSVDEEFCEEYTDAYDVIRSKCKKSYKCVFPDFKNTPGLFPYYCPSWISNSTDLLLRLLTKCYACCNRKYGNPLNPKNWVKHGACLGCCNEQEKAMHPMMNSCCG